jgi:cell division septation protein DedD
MERMGLSGMRGLVLIVCSNLFFLMIGVVIGRQVGSEMEALTAVPPAELVLEEQVEPAAFEAVVEALESTPERQRQSVSFPESAPPVDSRGVLSPQGVPSPAVNESLAAPSTAEKAVVKVEDVPAATVPVTPKAREKAPVAASAQKRAAGFFVQVSAASDASAAQALRKKLSAKGYPCVVVQEAGLHKVRLGPYADRAKADRVKVDVGRSDGLSGFVVSN